MQISKLTVFHRKCLECEPLEKKFEIKNPENLSVPRRGPRRDLMQIKNRSPIILEVKIRLRNPGNNDLEVRKIDKKAVWLFSKVHRQEE